MVTLAAFAVTDDEFDVDAPSAARPARDEPDLPEPSGIHTGVGHEVAELGVGTEQLPRVDVEVQTEAFTPTPRRQLFVSPTQTASPIGGGSQSRGNGSSPTGDPSGTAHCWLRRGNQIAVDIRC